jgi:cytochrome c-type biogenesis protein CcmH/NrfG
MRKDSLAFILIGFVIGFAALYTYTKDRAPSVVKATPRMPEGMSQSNPTGGQQPPAAPPVDMARVNQLQQVLKDDPRDFAALVEMGNVSFNQRNYEEAMAFYRKALEVNPNDVDVRTDLGTTLFFANRFDEAIGEFHKSLEMNPSHPQTLFNLGVALLQGKNDPAGAVQMWEKLIQTNPNYPQADLVKEQIAIVKERTKK